MMTSPGAEPEIMLVRTTVVSLALQALVKCLLAKGMLNSADLLTMRKVGLELSDELRANGHEGAQQVSDWIEREIAAWWDMAVEDGPADTTSQRH